MRMTVEQTGTVGKITTRSRHIWDLPEGGTKSLFASHCRRQRRKEDGAPPHFGCARRSWRKHAGPSTRSSTDLVNQCEMARVIKAVAKRRPVAKQMS